MSISRHKQGAAIVGTNLQRENETCSVWCEMKLGQSMFMSDVASGTLVQVAD
jgi:hypothetical protein